ASLEAVLADTVVIVPGNDPPDPAAGPVVEVEEVDKRALEVKDDGAIVDDLDVLELVLEELEVEPSIVLVRPFDVGRRQRMAVLEFEARTQTERRPEEVGAHLRVLGQAVGEF